MEVWGAPEKSDPIISFCLFTVSFCTIKLDVETLVTSNEFTVPFVMDPFRKVADELTNILPVLRLLLCTVPRILTPETLRLEEVMFVDIALVEVNEVVTVFLALRSDETWIVPEEAKDTFAVANTDTPETRRELEVMLVVTSWFNVDVSETNIVPVLRLLLETVPRIAVFVLVMFAEVIFDVTKLEA